MKEGEVVTVSGKLDERIRQKECTTGTIISVFGNDITVLFPDGDIWNGPKKHAYYAQDQEKPLKPKV